MPFGKAGSEGFAPGNFKFDESAAAIAGLKNNKRAFTFMHHQTAEIMSQMVGLV